MTDERKRKRAEYARKYRKTKKGFEVGKRTDFLKNLKRYGLTEDNYNNMLREQDGRCAICGDFPQLIDVERGESRYVTQSLVIDHDHITGKVRGLLCRNCNLGIGYLRDRLDILDSAKKYLSN